MCILACRNSGVPRLSTHFEIFSGASGAAYRVGPVEFVSVFVQARTPVAVDKRLLRRAADRSRAALDGIGIMGLHGQWMDLHRESRFENFDAWRLEGTPFLRPAGHD